METSLFLVFLASPVFFLLLLRLLRSTEAKLNLPPSPRSLPIIGHLHLLGRLPHRSLARLARLHGPLMHLRFGQVPVLVVSSSDAARQILKTHDLAFSGRFPMRAGEKLSYGGLGMSFAPYGAQWRFQRKLTLGEVFCQRKVESFVGIRCEEADVVVASIAKFSLMGSVNLTDLFFSFSCNVIYREVFGRRASEDSGCMKQQFQRLVMDCSAILSGLSLGDFFPSFKWVAAITGMEAKLNSCARRLDKLLEEELGAAHTEPCFAGTLLRLLGDPHLEFPLTRNHVKAVLMDMFLAGSETTAGVLEWAMTELVRNPEKLRRVQTEVRGAACQVEDGDLQGLSYLRMVIKETLRLHPPAPLSLPRETREACVVDGFDVAEGTRVIINVWAIGIDGRHWEAPEEFIPERFEGSDVDYKGNHFQFLPFGGGRRICPGMGLGVAGVELFLAKLLLRFDWELPEGMVAMDVEEAAGLSVRKRSPLFLKAIPV